MGKLGDNLARYHIIVDDIYFYKSIEKWNGILPQVSGGAVPFVDLGKMEGLSGKK